MWFVDGGLRLWPAWEIRAYGYTLPVIFIPATLIPGLMVTAAILYPWIEARFRKDRAAHHLLDRPRDAPDRTALGAMALTFYGVLSLSTANDVFADKFHVSLNAMTWAGRIGLLLLPPLAFSLTRRLCLGLQQHDLEVLTHGVETGIIKRLPDGRFIEVHQPLPANGHGDGDGHGLDYGRWVVPKKMNKLGALAPTVKGFFFPIEKAVPPPEAPVSPAPAREEITSGH
jgi:ubiquinol-cytochrome c reductase cytochrome b subunit